jgi:plasmid maintenance system antidote protein VapI
MNATASRKIPELLLALNRSNMTGWGVARAANIHPVKLSRVLNRHQRLTPDEGARLAKALAVKISDLGDIVA